MYRTHPSRVLLAGFVLLFAAVPVPASSAATTVTLVDGEWSALPGASGSIEVTVPGGVAQVRLVVITDAAVYTGQTWHGLGACDGLAGGPEGPLVLITPDRATQRTGVCGAVAPGPHVLSWSVDVGFATGSFRVEADVEG